jgi:hypothetical protein
VKTRKRYLAATTLVATFAMVAAATGQASGASDRASGISFSALKAATASAETLVAGRPDAIMGSAGEA